MNDDRREKNYIFMHSKRGNNSNGFEISQKYFSIDEEKKKELWSRPRKNVVEDAK